jgi:hypothetical protein
MMISLFELVKNPISIEGHIQSYPIVLQDRPGWEHPLKKALLVRNLFDGLGFEKAQVYLIAVICSCGC